MLEKKVVGVTSRQQQVLRVLATKVTFTHTHVTFRRTHLWRHLPTDGGPARGASGTHAESRAAHPEGGDPRGLRLLLTAEAGVG